MRLIKIKNHLINEDKFIGLFWEDSYHAVAYYYGRKGNIATAVLAKGDDWRVAMKEAAADMLFDLEQEEKEAFDGERRTKADN